MSSLRRIITGLYLFLFCFVIFPTLTKGDGGENVIILNESAQWRSYWVWRTVMKETGKGVYAPLTAYVPLGKDRKGEIDIGSWENADVAWSPLPQASWTKFDFDDSNWALWSKTWSWHGDDIGAVRYGTRVTPTLALRCLRTRFFAENPDAIEGLVLSVRYRGGIVVYLNGVELTRKNLPKDDELDMLAMADNYPESAYFHSSGKIYNVKHGPMSDGVNIRIRKIEKMSVPSKLLRKGVNVLSFEIHRAPCQEKLDFGNAWNSCGLVGMTLCADKAPGVGLNIGVRPTGIQVWNTSITKKVTAGDYGELFVPVKPIRIIGTRNGRFCGQIVVGSDQEMDAIEATVSDLKAVNGIGVIPKSRIEVLYNGNHGSRRLRPTLAGGCDELMPLSPVPPQKVAIPKNYTTSIKDNFGAEMPIWVKVDVPKDVSAGEFHGSISITVAGVQVANVPIQMEVVDWALPDPKEYALHINLIQSPETIALKYNVPLWSDEHFALIEKSFKLLGQVGAKHLYLPLITRTNFGNSESMVRWIKKADGTYDHDFSVFDAYLDIALRYLKPEIICLYTWDLYMGGHGGGGRLGAVSKGSEGSGPKVTLVDPETRVVREFQGPNCRTAEAREFWRPVFEKIRLLLQKRGLEKTMMLGITDDFIPDDDVLDLFCELLPGVPWVQNSHEPFFGIRRNDVSMGYNAAVYLGLLPVPQPWNEDRLSGWKLKIPTGIFPRPVGPVLRHVMRPFTHVGLHRIINEAALLGNCSGLGRVGLDFWPVLKMGRQMKTLNARYPETTWVQLNMFTATLALLEPGPNGAVTTPRFENIREGVQECEARIFIEKAILNSELRSKMGEELAVKCEKMLDERHLIIRAVCTAGEFGGSRYYPFLWTEGAPLVGLSRKLFEAAGEVARALEVQ